MKDLLKQVARFGVVGLAATGTHFILAFLLMSGSVPPLLANFYAFLAAFAVSYLGHSRWSFAHKKPGQHSTLLRFLLVSLLGFAANEILFAGLLYVAKLPPSLALAMTLVVIAGFTFLLSRNWAFVESLDKSGLTPELEPPGDLDRPFEKPQKKGPDHPGDSSDQAGHREPVSQSGV